MTYDSDISVIGVTYLFFFLNHQFITWDVVTDHDSYFITTYKRHRQHEGEEKEKENRDKIKEKRAN